MNQNGLLYEIHTTEMNVLHIFAAISEKKKPQEDFANINNDCKSKFH